MIIAFRNSFLIALFFSFPFFHSALAQLTANAGANQTICPGDSIQIGSLSAAAGGLPPYHYQWSPSTGLTSSNIPNPIAYPYSPTVYTLTVADDTGAVATDAVNITFNYIYKVNAGTDISVCQDGYTILGSPYNIIGQGISYQWAPATGLDYDTVPRPICNPLQPTTYTLTVTMAGCDTKITYITVNILYLNISAGPDATIDEGQTIQLQATGGFFYYWDAEPSLTNITTPNPDAEPIATTTYFVWGESLTHQCAKGDSITVHVIKGDNVFFYNTFSPNGDNINDLWYIGNIWKYPNNMLQVFNRNGQLVYRQEGYNNTWDGKSFGQDLPAATYFYVLDLGNDNEDSYHGTVSIIR